MLSECLVYLKTVRRHRPSESMLKQEHIINGSVLMYITDHIGKITSNKGLPRINSSKTQVLELKTV